MTTILTTDRLTLRRVEEKDRKALLTHLNNFDIVSKLTPVPYPYHDTDADQFLDLTTRENESGAGLHAAITCGTDDQMVGCITLGHRGMQPGWFVLGYWLAQSHWGQGLMSEAAVAVRDYGFNQMKAKGLHSNALTDNHRSWAVLMKLGFIETDPIDRFSVSLQKTVCLNACNLTRQDWEGLQ